MNKEEKLKLVFKLLRNESLHWTKNTIDKVKGIKGVGFGIDSKDYKILGDCLSTNKIILNAFETVLKNNNRSLLESMLHRIDSSISDDPLLNVDLIDRDTGESLHPENGSYDMEFGLYMMKEDEKEGIAE